MKLSSYLRQFKNICWYPSAFKDSLSMVALSYQSLVDYGISKKEAPDCFIFTDYETYSGVSENKKFFLELDEYENETPFCYPGSNYSVTAFNIKELERLDLPFDQNMVAFSNDSNYGRVFIADILIEHPDIGKAITKLVYVISENTSFAFEFLIKKHIKIKYAIHSRYGHGFGGGISNGLFMCNILKDLKVKYFISDIDNHYLDDVADKYLTDKQKETIPVLKEICNFYYVFGWSGYNDNLLYEVVRYIYPNKNIGRRFLVE